MVRCSKTACDERATESGGGSSFELFTQALLRCASLLSLLACLFATLQICPLLHPQSVEDSEPKEWLPCYRGHNGIYGI